MEYSDYGGEDGLRQALEEGITLGQFNAEQQAEIFVDYWERNSKVLWRGC